MAIIAALHAEGFCFLLFIEGMDLSKVKLKHVEKKDNPKKTTDVEENGASLALLIRRVRECDLDVWYEKLEKHTFATRMIPISVELARRMVAAIKKRTGLEKNDVHPELEELEKVIVSFGCAFVKLSSRSPKDATVAGERTRAAFEREFAACEEKDDNAKFICLNRAHISALSVTCAKDALDLLLASERILDDLELALEDPSKWNQVKKHLLPQKRRLIVDLSFHPITSTWWFANGKLCHCRPNFVDLS